MNAPDLTVAQLVTLADAHIQRFTGMIVSGGRHVNVPECERYLSIWQEVRYKAALGFTRRPRDRDRVGTRRLHARLFVERAARRPRDRDSALDHEGQCEVSDAVFCGDYDYIWGAS